MHHSRNTTSVRISMVTVAALTLVWASASLAHTARLPNCSVAETTPCFEKVWADGEQLKMTFIDLNPQPASASDVPFYLVAPQTGTPQGLVPFLHDHVTDETRSEEARHGRSRHEERSGDFNLHYHGFFVFCSAQGISSGACVPTMTALPQVVPLAKAVNGQMLTSVDRIESAAKSGDVILVDTGGVFIASLRTDED
jgi:hypothetical protein